MRGVGIVQPWLAQHASRCIAGSQKATCRERVPKSTASSLAVLSDEDKYYYKEIPNFQLEYNASAPGDFYELLGIDVEADPGVIKSAYRDKQRLVHPDIAGMTMGTPTPDEGSLPRRFCRGFVCSAE